MRPNIVVSAALLGGANAAPAAGLLGGLLGSKGALLSDTTGLLDGLTGALTGTLGQTVNKIESQLNDVGVVGSSLLGQLGEITPKGKPATIQDAAAIIKKLGGFHPEDLLGSAVKLVLAGFGPTSLDGVMEMYSAGSNNENNVNTREPATAIYPQLSQDDVKYSVDEAKLRAAIYIPDSFTYGKKPPVILVPGTATKGGLCYEANLAKLLPQTDYADPVWLNVPGWLLEEVPWNSEFVAYAINYISSITAQNVSVIALSQGNLDTQWAFTYWPSTRKVVNDYIAVSPDYHGSSLLNILCPKLGVLSCPPAVAQQVYNANFISHFRAAGGDSAYVPTTTVFSATDDVVQPQHGSGASAYLQDTRSVGVLNVEMQTVCPVDSPALVGTHESALWGAPLQALIKDALTHDGPADISRIPNWNNECSKIAADGLNVEDVIGTTAAIPVAFAIMFAYPKRVTTEPALPAYAK